MEYQKEKWNLSSRSQSKPEMDVLQNYQHELINYLMYEKNTSFQKDKLIKEIKDTEIYLKNNYIKHFN